MWLDIVLSRNFVLAAFSTNELRTSARPRREDFIFMLRLQFSINLDGMLMRTLVASSIFHQGALLFPLLSLSGRVCSLGSISAREERTIKPIYLRKITHL